MVNGLIFTPETWQPTEYNRIYYPSESIGLENEKLVAGQVEIWRKISRLLPLALSPPNASNDLDLVILGGGGTLWDLPAAVPYVKNVCYTDPFEKSRTMVRQFINDSANDYWDSYIAHTLKQEGAKHVSATMIRERARLIRQRIVSVEECDVYEHPPVAAISGGVPIVAAHFVMDSITNSKEVWHQLMRNVGDLVLEGGCLIMSSLGKAHRWRSSICAGPEQPATYLTMQDIHLVMAEIGFEIFYLQWIAAEEPNRDDYRGLIVCGCQKLARKPGD
jgi:NNMT/PNMT/TEMT family